MNSGLQRGSVSRLALVVLLCAACALASCAWPWGMLEQNRCRDPRGFPSCSDVAAVDAADTGRETSFDDLIEVESVDVPLPDVTPSDGSADAAMDGVSADAVDGASSDARMDVVALPDVVCRRGELPCDGRCVDVNENSDHCGACGVRCAPPSGFCAYGRCFTGCGGNRQTCCAGGVCSAGLVCNPLTAMGMICESPVSCFPLRPECCCQGRDFCCPLGRTCQMPGPTWTCQTCGIAGTNCCPGNNCNAGYTCMGGNCLGCGARGEPCCRGTCTGGLICDGRSICVAPG